MNRARSVTIKKEPLFFVVFFNFFKFGIDDIIKTFKLGMKTKFFLEILLETMEIPEELQL